MSEHAKALPDKSKQNLSPVSDKAWHFFSLNYLGVCLYSNLYSHS